MSGGPPPAWQFALAGYFPLLTGNLSVIGSGLIIYSILGPGRTEKLKKPHLRLLLGMSFWDLMYSLIKAFTFLFSPKGISGMPGALGNMSTCRFQGFFIQMAHCTAAYNALLSTYYWLTVSRGIKNEVWAKWEPFMHLGIVVVNAGLGAVGVATRLYNPSFSFCFIAAFPAGCETGPGTPPCLYYSQSQIPLMYELFANMFAQFYILVVFATCFAIWWTVRAQEKAMKRYGAAAHGGGARGGGIGRKARKLSSQLSVRTFSFRRQGTSSGSTGGSTTGGGSGNIDEVDNNSCDDPEQPRGMNLPRRSSERSQMRQQRKKQKRNHQVFRQCVLYAGSFFFCWLGPVMFHLIGWINQVQSFAFVMLIVTITPLQGFFNAFAFARPTYLRLRRKYRHLTRWDAFKRVFLVEDPMRDVCATDSRASLINKNNMNNKWSSNNTDNSAFQSNVSRDPIPEEGEEEGQEEEREREEDKQDGAISSGSSLGSSLGDSDENNSKSTTDLRDSSTSQHLRNYVMQRQHSAIHAQIISMAKNGDNHLDNDEVQKLVAEGGGVAREEFHDDDDANKSGNHDDGRADSCSSHPLDEIEQVQSLRPPDPPAWTHAERGYSF